MDSPFERAADAIVNGDLATLAALLNQDPKLIHERSDRAHHATLLHYLAANGVEQERQKSPANAAEIARLLLERGAEVDARAEMYGGQQTTINMLVSSFPPSAAGVQDELVEILLDAGAANNDALITALAHGRLSAARTLARRGANTDSLPAAAGLGHLASVEKLLLSANEEDRHRALALAAQHGHASIVKLLLDAGEDPNRYNPPRFHGHSTPLHQAVCYGHEAVVRLLIERGARIDIKDTVYEGTPLGWAKHEGRLELEQFLQ